MLRRPLAALGLLTLAFVVLAGCEPAPPGQPAVRGYRFDIVAGGPLVIGANADDDPIPLGDTPPDVRVLAKDEACDPVAQNGSFQLSKGWYVAQDGTGYEAWFVAGGTQSAIVPGDPKCLPAADGTSYVLGAVADTKNDDGPVDGKVVGGAIDERACQACQGVPKFKLVK